MIRLCRRWLRRWWLGLRGPTYFVTWRLDAGQLALGFRERDLVAHTLFHGHGDRYDLIAFVVMDDHVHVVVRPATVALQRLLHSWKSHSTHELQRVHGRRGVIWQPDSAERTLRGGRDLADAVDYITANPWIRWPYLRSYDWAWEDDDR